MTSSLAVLKEVTKGTGGAKDTIGNAVSYTVSGDIKTILEAVYTPNAPDTSDSFVPLEAGQGKSTVAYTAEVSAEVLKLFYITIAEDAKDDLIEVKGSLSDSILSQTGTGFDKPILLIDIGLPETDNSTLPTFSIPTGGFGNIGGTGDLTGDTTYGGVRLRVNKGAYLVIEADNTNYPTSSCPSGRFNGGCVEVLDGGRLRDGAYQGFPLGDNATILNRLGSYLAVGPKDSTNEYYTGWLIGKTDSTKDDSDMYKVPRIEWDDQTNGYIEVRPGELVLSAKVTVKKLLGLIYSVWFVDTLGSGGKLTEAGLTINVEEDTATAYPEGLINGGSYRFYGQEGHTITITKGHIQGSFLKDDAEPTDFIPALSPPPPPSPTYPIIIKNNGSDADPAVQPKSAERFAGTSGYLNWESVQDSTQA